MALHKLLIDDFDDGSFVLFAIHCNIEDYRLAYLLNQQLHINLQRKAQNLDYKYTWASYAIYEWENEAQQVIWNLVSNICKKEEEGVSSSGNLFNNEQKIIRTHNLISEHKNANYLLKIEIDNFHINEKTLLDKIQKITQVATAYSIDVSQLKSKDNLIFN